MSTRYVSTPLLSLLHQAGLAPQEVDAALDRQANRWAHTLLRKSHAYIRQLRKGTGCEVVGISRKYRRLLVDIEQHGTDGSIAWRYREFGRANCSFWFSGTIPDTVATALPGRPLGDLIQPFPTLSAARINEVMAVGDGWIELSIDLAWTAF